MQSSKEVMWVSRAGRGRGGRCGRNGVFRKLPLGEGGLPPRPAARSLIPLD